MIEITTRLRLRACLLAALAACAAQVSCQPPRVIPPLPVALVVEPPINPAIERVNAASYPGGTYLVRPGDTPRGVAAALGVDFTALAAMNALQETTPLNPGELLIIPRIGQDPATLPGRQPAQPINVSEPPARPTRATPPYKTSASSTPTRAAGGTGAAGAGGTGAAGVSGVPAAVAVRDGFVRSDYAGTVTAVHRGYPSLGNVVIIEGAFEKVIYSGTFEPTVAKGAVITQGAALGSAANGAAVKCARFQK